MSDDYTPYLAFAADLHLQPGAWASHPHIQGDSYNALRQIVSFCVARDCPLILGGDIFDKRRPDPHSVGVFITEMNRMRQANLAVLYVSGDHDYSVDTPWPDAASVNASHLHKDVAEWSKLGRIYGLDWTPKDRLHEALAEIPPDCNVLVTHQSWDELQGIGNVEGWIATLPRHVTTLLTGDYHVHLQRKIKADAGQEVRVYSPGSTCMQAIDENPDKHFWVYSASDERDDGVWTSVPIAGRQAFFYELHDEETFNQWAANKIDFSVCFHDILPSELHKPIVRVTYPDNIPDAVARIEAAVEDAHLFLNPQHVYVEQCVEIAEAPEGAFDTLEGAVQQLGDDDDVVNGVHRLLNSANPTKEIELMMQEFLHAAQQEGAVHQGDDAPVGEPTGAPDAT